MTYYFDKHRHLVCVPYTVANLHAMARALGIKRCWFHNGSYAHYDVPKRDMARMPSVAIEVSGRTILVIVKGGLPA